MITRIEWATDGPVHLQVLAEDGTILTDVPSVMTLREAARILKKSRRHLYRYIVRGWIKPLAKFSGEFFIDPSQVTKIKEHNISRQTALPPRLAPLFPDYDLRSLHLTRDRNLILTRVLERGSSIDIRWLKKRFSSKAIKDFVKTEGSSRLSPQAQRYWELITEVKSTEKSRPWQEVGRQLGGAT